MKRMLVIMFVLLSSVCASVIGQVNVLHVQNKTKDSFILAIKAPNYTAQFVSTDEPWIWTAAVAPEEDRSVRVHDLSGFKDVDVRIFALLPALFLTLYDNEGNMIVEKKINFDAREAMHSGTGLDILIQRDDKQITVSSELF